MHRDGFILIVEDDAEVREGMTVLLEESGYRIMAVANGQEALDLMQAKVPCMVLLDLMMPVMTGWALHAAMRSDGRLKGVPICVVSAVASHAPADAECVLEKPVQVPKLLDAVASFC
ncbi:MAG: response regulator [bacterium]|nr:response regulator [bacterium]